MMNDLTERIAMRLLACRSAAVCGMVMLGFALLVGGPARADVWQIERNTTVVHFTYDHLGLSRQSGRFKDIEGKLEFSPTEPERGAVDITIKAAGVSTGVPELDRLLRSSDFLDTARHPTIRFRSVGVKPTGEKTGELDGELTFMGVTWPVTMKVRWNFTGEYPLAAVNPAYQGRWVSGFSATTVIERSRWGLKRGIPLISDAVEIAIEAEFVRVER
jgi:polyisoprenoid-binding protein YceI